MSKQNVSEGFRQKVKQFFGVKKGNVITSSVYEGPKPDEFYFHQELLQEISKESPLSNRVKVLRELCDFLASRRVEDHAIEAAWEAVNDLLEASNPVEARHVTLQFLTVMVFAQLGRLGILRAHFFSVVAGHKVAEDVSPRLELLKALSDNGKDISYFEEVTGPFLLSWMPEVMKGGRMDVFMPLVINVIHYNSSFLDEDIITGIVRETCNVTRTTKEEEDIELCLCLLDAVVRYSCLPSNALFDFIAIACRAVNIEKFCQHSWKIMRNLLGTHLGHRGVYTMCNIMEDSDNHSDTMLLRGSVFFIGMCLWGSQRVPNLKYSNTTVLPSMLQALSSHYSLVALEVTLSVQRLVKKYGHELNVVAWDSVLDISEALQKQIEVYSPGENSLIENLHILFTSIEELFETDKFNGPEERFFALIEKSASKRPEHSLHVLVSFKAQTVHPAQEGWLTNLHNLMEKYFRYEIRTSVRAKVLSVLSSLLTSYGHWYEDELLDVAVLPYLSHISEDQDVTVRNEAAQIIIDLCLTSDSLKCQDFLSIIEKVISRHVELLGKGQQLDEQEQLLQEEKELKDVKTAVSGLVQVFKAKLFRLPHSHAVKALQLLVSHVKAHYDHRYSTYIASIIRIMTFECFLSLRCDSSLRIGVCNSSEEENNTKFSRYFTCWHSDLDAKPSSHLGIIQYSEVFEVILKCVQDEWDWTVLEHVLKALPEVLQNKSLILSANPALNAMTSVLCHMVLEPSYIHDLHRVPSGVGRVGLLALIFQVLTVLATYHSNLDRRRQVELVRALELGLGTKCAVRCVSSLTLCTMEMQAVMKSLLPALLFRLSQISATVAMAAPMLEFLSGLVHLPHLYTSFQDSQYKSVFAICLPYTDPYRYSQYTVTLAYHVIAAWFVRSRLAYRKAFVGFVSKGLKASAVNPERFDPRPDSPALATAKSHSNNVSNQPSPQTAPRSISPVTKKETDSSCELHSEMSEVCMDMMARYAFAPCMSQPNRTKAVEFMLASGHSRTWMINNTIVTISTSGTYVGLDGVCENCLALREQKFDISSLEKSKLEKILQQRTTAIAADSAETLLTQASSDHSQGTGIGTRSSANSQTKPDASPKPDSKFTSLEKTALHKSLSVDTAKLKSLSEARSSNASERRNSEPVASAVNPRNCQCVCQGWAEILIRRPCGNLSWIMRIQNRETSASLDGDVSMAVVDDPQIGDFLSTESEKHSEILSTSTESGSVIVDVVRQPKPLDEFSNSVRQHHENESDKTMEPAQLDPVLIYSPSGSLTSPSSTTSQSLESEPYETRDRLLSQSPRKPANVFTMTEPDSCGALGSPEITSTSTEDVAQNQYRHKLRFEKPELGVSPAESYQVSSLPQQNQLGQRREYLSSSEMYRLASDEENVLSRKVEDHRERTGEQGIEFSETGKGEHHAVSQTRKDQRSNSRPCHTTDTDLQMTRDSADANGKAALTLSLDSGSRVAQLRELETESQAPKKSKLKKSSSTNSPIRNKSVLSQSLHSPFASPLQSRRSMAKKSKEAEDRLGLMSASGQPKKSSSSPELSSPPAFPRALGKTSSSRIVSHGGRPQSISKSDKSAPLPGDVADTGPKEPPILVTPSESFRYSLDPSFVFLQLYHASFLGSSNEKPEPLPDSEVIERAIKCLDRIPPYDTHKIGVIYVGPGQHDNEAAILGNVYGSSRYMTFLSGLGTLVRLRDCPPAEIYTGGLDRNGEDGEFAYSWQDDICQVIFHVATLMPTRESDPGCNSKKLHIGNDFVTIVYNDSQQTVKFGRIKGQFNFAEVVIKPLDNASNMVTLRFKDELKDLLTDSGPRVISDANLPRLVRQLVVHINMASVIHQSQKRPTDAYGCNWLERLRQLKRVRSKAAAENFSVPGSPIGKSSPSLGLRPPSLSVTGLTDFTEYVVIK
ncbi:tuberin-like isoform X1 [Acropora muricata]|uniref:tuberin-like isoform X1 n=1 Tax=Acropora muricata TaxID=159855 RepID=UPI0034E54774